MEKFFEQGGLSEEEMRAGIHAAIQKQVFVPLFVRLGGKQHRRGAPDGFHRQIRFVARGPRRRSRPLTRTATPVELALTDPDPVCYVFKTMSEAQFGELSFFRVYSGQVKFGGELYNTDRRIEREDRPDLHPQRQEPHDACPRSNAGDIGAVVKLKDTHTGNTLCGAKNPVSLPKVEYPKPNIHASLKSNVKGEEEKIASGLAALHHEDPTFLAHGGRGIASDDSLRAGRIAPGSHRRPLAPALQRACRIDRAARALPRNDQRQRRIEISPQETDRRRGTICRSLDAHRAASRATRASSSPSRSSARTWTACLCRRWRKGVMKACEEGILAGYRVVDVKIDFYDGKMHPVDSKDIAFQIAGYFAFKEVVHGGPALPAGADSHR